MMCRCADTARFAQAVVYITCCMSQVAANIRQWPCCLQVNRTTDNIYTHGTKTAKKYSTEEYGNLDTYQVRLFYEDPRPQRRLS